MSNIEMSNAQHPDQIARMAELEKTGQCHFCREGFETRHVAPIIYETDTWFVTANNYPYNGTVHHYLLVPKIHITKVKELAGEKLREFQTGYFDACAWTENYLQHPGGTFFGRSGNMRHTGATLGHLHFHYIAGAEKIGDTPNHERTDLILVVAGFKKQ